MRLDGRQYHHMTKNSQKILDKKRYEVEGKPPVYSGDFGSLFANKLDSKYEMFSPFSMKSKGVVSDFINVPTTPAKQLQRDQLHKSHNNDIITAYRREIKSMISPQRNSEPQNQMRESAGKSRNTEMTENATRKTGKTTVTVSDSKYVHTHRSSRSGLHSHLGFQKSNREFFSEENNDQDTSENIDL